MGRLAEATPDALSLDEVCRQAGLSRGTLHNYVQRGLIPKPDLCRDREAGRRYRKMSYFPPSVLERIASIRRLKEDGADAPFVEAPCFTTRRRDGDGIGSFYPKRGRFASASS